MLLKILWNIRQEKSTICFKIDFMKKFDLYGQLVLIVLSYLVLINIYSDDWLAPILYHGIFLILIAIWQIISTIKNIAAYDSTINTDFFKTNIQIAVIYFTVYFYSLFTFGLSAWFVVPSFLLAHILIIRYWRGLKKHYQL